MRVVVTGSGIHSARTSPSADTTSSASTLACRSSRGIVDGGRDVAEGHPPLEPGADAIVHIALQRSGRTARTGRHLRDQPPRLPPPRGGCATTCPPLRLHVLVQRVWRIGSGVRRRGVAAQPADGVCGVQGARRARSRADKILFGSSVTFPCPRSRYWSKRWCDSDK